MQSLNSISFTVFVLQVDRVFVVSGDFRRDGHGRRVLLLRLILLPFPPLEGRCGREVGLPQHGPERQPIINLAC